MTKLGRFIISRGTIPAGGDAYITHRVITAGDKPILIQAGTWWGGDASEYIKFMLVTPNSEGIGEKDADHFISAGNGIPVFDGNLAGGETPNTTYSMFGSWTRSQMGTVFYLPPHYSIVVYASAANTAAWEVTLGGYECESYA